MYFKQLFLGAACLAAAGLVTPAQAADPSAVVEGDWVADNFTFHDGSVLPGLKIHYRTVGNPSGDPVLFLHGTGGSGGGMLTPFIVDELFGPGQPLDTETHFIILPDAIGTGNTTKPSDGLKAKFPDYTYEDMVKAQYRLVTEGLNIKHLRLVIGHSMGGMHTWMWGTMYPDMMDALVPMASMPTEMSGRNWMMRRMIIDAVRNDPAWQNGDYTEQPQHFRLVNAWYGIATNGGTLAYQKAAPTRQAADDLVAQRTSSLTKMDANDFLYQWNSSRDYNPEPMLDRITAHVLAINAADDERNPPETGLMEQGIGKIPNAQYFLIPASAETLGHNTTSRAKFYRDRLGDFLKSVPKK
ncbi:MAG: alpha/beta fold hydrolase [Methylobacteriaceae bacterium]|nr:alpha/beta fold hydrolase [Methylobacteriaceae bacterium]